MLDQAFVEEIIPVLIAESTHPTVKGITAEVIRQLGLRGRSAVVAERRIRPMVIDALREHFGDDDAADEDFDEEDFEDEDEYGFDEDDEDEEDFEDEDEYGFDEDDEYPYGGDDEDFEDEDELDGYSYDDEDDGDDDDL